MADPPAPLVAAPAASRSLSLRQRLILWLSVAGATLGALALIDTRAEALRTAQGVSDRVLAGSAMAIAEQITISEDGGVDVMVPYSALEMLSSAAQDLVFYRIDGPGGFITGYADLPRADQNVADQNGTVPVAAAAAGSNPAYADIDYGEARLRAATLRRLLSDDSGTQAFTVTVAESTRARNELGQAILLRSALRLTLLMAALGAIAWLVVTLALRPLERLGSAIAGRAASDMRPIRAEVPHEVAPLVGAVNLFMARLGGTIQAMGRFTANANHQVRTPLATARTHLALAGRAGADLPGSLAKADAALVRAERVLQQLLLLARVDAEGARAQLVPLDLASLAREIAAEAIPAATARRQDLGYDGPDSAMIQAEPVLMAEALRNLVDNAVIHNPAGTIITLRVQTGPEGTAISVIDNGRGIAGPALGRAAFVPPDQDQTRASTTPNSGNAHVRGQNAFRAAGPDPDNGSTDGASIHGPSVDGASIDAHSLGHGLGLSIVREIGALIGASVSVSAGPDHRGTDVTLLFG